MHIGSSYYTEDELVTFNFKAIGRNVKIKKNTGIFFTENISIGDNVRIDDNSIIVASREPVKIGSYIHIGSNCYIAGSEGLVMHDFSGIAPGVMIFTGSDDYSGKKLTNPTVTRKYIGGASGLVELGRHVIIGAGSVILPRVRIGEGASVGALSYISMSLSPWFVYQGNPIRKLWPRSKNLLDLEKEFLSENKI
jgi:galactoside O-acetyltransferase